MASRRPPPSLKHRQTRCPKRRMRDCLQPRVLANTPSELRFSTKSIGRWSSLSRLCLGSLRFQSSQKSARRPKGYTNKRTKRTCVKGFLFLVSCRSGPYVYGCEAALNERFARPAMKFKRLKGHDPSQFSSHILSVLLE
jgi:hypothetical protein